MNSKSKTVQQIIRTIVAVTLTAVFTSAAVAGEKTPHNPYTYLGMQIRTHLLPTTPGANGESLGPLVFQEIVPCRFVSTLVRGIVVCEGGELLDRQIPTPRGIMPGGYGIQVFGLVCRRWECWHQPTCQ